MNIETFGSPFYFYIYVTPINKETKITKVARIYIITWMPIPGWIFVSSLGLIGSSIIYAKANGSKR
jgi:hypothetical protein